jgi:hypothetical protein
MEVLMFCSRFMVGAMMIGVGTLLSPVFAQSTSSPVVFYSDLISGPNIGGENNNGVIVTINGKNFGNIRGSSTVTVGGGAVADYKTWTDTKIQVAIGAAAATGGIAVNVAGSSSTCANPDPGGCSFTVRKGNIYYVSNSGNDGGSGSFPAPWKTLYHAVRAVSAGDTIYAENGVSVSAPDGTGWHSALLLGTGNGVVSGASGNPIALVAYPGATVTIGSLTAMSASGDTTIYGLRESGGITDYVISGLTLRGPEVAADLDGDFRWRVINNDISAGDPGANVMGAFTLREGGNDVFYGNNVHDVGTSSKEGHSVYFSTDNNHVWAAWNTLVNNTTCYEMQFHSSPLGSGSGNDMYDLHVHDNYFNGDRCAGLNFATVDPSKGTVEAYNNVFFHVGNGPAPADGAYNFACIYAAGILNNGPAPSGTVQIYNNTAYDCGKSGLGAQGVVLINDQGSGSAIHYNLTNNILSGMPSETPYVAFSGGNSSYVSCANNLFYNNGPAPSFCSAQAVNANPAFLSVTLPNLDVPLTSPALKAGSTSLYPRFDFTGALRPSSPAIGAYDSGSGTASAPAPAAPTNLQGVVK